MTGAKPSAPPPGLPWDAPLVEAPLAFVDLEMTGLGEGDRVIEVCIERVLGDELVGKLETLVRPDDARFGNAHIHGIAPGDLASAPLFASIADRVEELLSGAVFVAHAARYDIAFLRSEMGRLGRTFDVPFAVDTLALSRRAFGFKSHALGALAEELHVDRGKAHRAGDDVRVLRAVFVRLVEILRPTSARDLFEVRVGERMARESVLEKLHEAEKSGAPQKVRYRPSGKRAEDLVFVVTGVRAEPAANNRVDGARTRLDPPVVFGYLLPSRGRRQLRADRILSVEPLS
jgi:DNA polymerase-3 subunit epsilon